MISGSKCKQENCDRPKACLGYCTVHYERSRNGSDMSAPIRTYVRGRVGCSVDGCTRKHGTHGKCFLHAHRAWHLKTTYKMSEEDFERMKAKQNGACAVCLTTEPLTRSGVFAIDHDHRTGAVRGLLCMQCNVALGAVKDRIDILERLIEYLRRSGGAVA